MDAQAQKKALFRAKVREAAQKREKHIDSPLVRYNEHEQPVCRVCDVILKSESLWPAHQASRKHHEAIKNVKAAAAGLTRVNDVKTDTHTESVTKSRPSSSLPTNFFDKPDSKKPKASSKAGSKIDPVAPAISVKPVNSLVADYFPQACASANEADELVSVNAAAAAAAAARDSNETDLPTQLDNLSGKADTMEIKQAKGALPEGFFDNKDADLRARGIEPVKLDIKDEYKEFEKAIHEDLQGVDERLVEEEFDAAETIEEAESLEQQAYFERVEMLKKKQMELKAAKSAHGEKKPPKFMGVKLSGESSNDEDDGEDYFAVDWRAKHL